MSEKLEFRMSSAGTCARALSAEILGNEIEPLPEFVYKAAEEGNWHEKRIKEQLKSEGFNVHDEQLELVLEYPSFNLVGHIDGKVKNIIFAHNVNAPEEKLLEIKSMSQFQFDKWMKEGFSGFPSYAAQITCYMEATGLNECLYIVKNRSSGYESRRVLTEKPMHMTEIIAKLTEVNNYVLSGELVPIEFNSNNLECRRCGYKNLCIPEVEELTTVEQADLESATDNWREGKKLVGQGNELMNNAKEMLEHHTRATNQTKWRFNELAIQLIQVKEGQVAYTRKASEYIKILELRKRENN